MARMTTHSVLMGQAKLWAQRSTCSRAQVGCVIAYEGRALTNGYNGAPSGMPHCQHGIWAFDGHAEMPEWLHNYLDNKDPNFEIEIGPGMVFYWDGRSIQIRQGFNNMEVPTCSISVHAEANAIAWSARRGIALEGSTLYTTLSPCVWCAQQIINAGVTAVISDNMYRDTGGLELLAAAGVEIMRMVDLDEYESR